MHVLGFFRSDREHLDRTSSPLGEILHVAWIEIYVLFFILGFAWYHFSGTRQVVNTARDAVNKAKELKDKVKETAAGSADSASNTVNYLRSATATLIPGSAPFLGKVFDQIDQISKEHGDDVKKIFDETYKDFEKLAKDGGLDTQTASKAVDILQKRVKELQDLAGEVGGDAYSKLISDNPKLKDQISKHYDTLKDVVEKAKDKNQKHIYFNSCYM